MFETLPDSSKVALVGDNSLHIMKTRIPETLFDLPPKAHFLTKKTALTTDIVMMGRVGPLLRKIPPAVQTIVLSIGRDDLLQDPRVFRKTSQTWDVDKDDLKKHNQSILKEVADRVITAVNRVTDAHDGVKIFYILPPPSAREKELLSQLRDSLPTKQAELQAVTVIDVEPYLGDEQEMEPQEAGAGTWPKKGERILMKQVYRHIFPQVTKNFCDVCHGLHDRICLAGPPPQPQTTPPGCWICFNPAHQSTRCPVNERLLKDKIYCPHCGARPAVLTHSPDNCPNKLALCSKCDIIGHKSSLHESPTTVKAAH